MKTAFSKFLIMVGIMTGIAAFAPAASAFGIGVNLGGGYYGGNYCHWVPGHYRHGFWVPGHNSCGGGYYYGPRCRWHHGYRVCY